MSASASFPKAHRLLIGEPRRMRYIERWRLEAEGLDLGSTFLCGDRLVVKTSGAVLAIDRDAGEVIWRIGRSSSAGRLDGAYLSTAGDRGLIRVFPDGRVAFVDLADGSEAWSAWLGPAGGRPRVVTTGSRRIPRLVVLGESRAGGRRLVALDIRTGEVRWRFALRRTGDRDGFTLRRAGRLLLAAAGDGCVRALDAETGTVLWRHARDGRSPPRLAVDRDRVAVVSGPVGRAAAALDVLDRLTGRAIFRLELPGTPLADPLFCSNVALVATGDPRGVGRPGITAVETTTGVQLWRRTVPALDRGFAWLPVDEQIIVNIAGGHTLALHAPTGDVAWEQRTTGEYPGDVPERLEPVLRGGALFLPGAVLYVVRPGDGEVIHVLHDGPVPDYVRVDERCHLYVGERSGRLAAFGLVARLAVVV